MPSTMPILGAQPARGGALQTWYDSYKAKRPVAPGREQQRGTLGAPPKVDYGGQVGAMASDLRPAIPAVSTPRAEAAPIVRVPVAPVTPVPRVEATPAARAPAATVPVAAATPAPARAESVPVERAPVEARPESIVRQESRPMFEAGTTPAQQAREPDNVGRPVGPARSEARPIAPPPPPPPVRYEAAPVDLAHFRKPQAPAPAAATPVRNTAEAQRNLLRQQMDQAIRRGDFAAMARYQQQLNSMMSLGGHAGQDSVFVAPTAA